MALEIKLGQELRLRQQLVMTPQLQQAIKILQLSLPELETVIRSELEQNPMLEPLDESPGQAVSRDAAPEAGAAEPPGGEPLAPQAEGSANTPEPGAPSSDSGPSDGVHSEAHDAAQEMGELNHLEKLDWREYFENYSNNWPASVPRDAEERTNSIESTLVRRTSLADHLIWQLRMADLGHDAQQIGAAIIYDLSEDGYLEVPVEEIAAQLETPIEKVEQVLRRVQRFDPPGVAARDLRECLLLQLQSMGMEDSLAAFIVRDQIDLLRKHRYREIARALEVSSDLIARAARVISLLEPKPGRDYGGALPTYIVPDVFIHKMGEEYAVTLNREAVPQLRLAGYYQRVMNDDTVAADAREYLTERFRSAKWLVKSIYQRQQTIFKVATSIVKFQRSFFDHGISRLRPLVLKDVAEDIGMHESTISRATANKYAHTPQGIFELRFFFTSGLKATSGEDVSAETVKEQIRAMVSLEPPSSPLSDQAIADRLMANQIRIARRTVAKYRQALGILPSASRRQAGES